MSEQEMIAQGVAEAERICEAARTQRQAAWPQVVGEYVAFQEGDRRFHIHEVTTLYVELYLKEEAGVRNLDEALLDEHHVRELIEVITS